MAGRPDGTHCAHGHEMTGDNIRVRTSGGKRRRDCIACDRIRPAAKRARAAEPEPVRQISEPEIEAARRERDRYIARRRARGVPPGGRRAA